MGTELKVTEKRRQVQTGLKLDPDLYELLKAEAKRERLPVARVIARLIHRHYQRKKQIAA